MSTTNWPDGATAKYRTIGGATVNVTGKTAHCTGCIWNDGPFWTETAAHQLAQTHAEKCRALPRPEVTP